MNAELTFLNALQALRTPALDGVMRFFTHLGDSGFVWLALTALLLAFRRTRLAGWMLAAALLFDAVLCNILLKPMVVAAEAAAAGMQTHSTAASRNAAARRAKECRCFKVRFPPCGYHLRFDLTLV